MQTVKFSTIPVTPSGGYSVPKTTQIHRRLLLSPNLNKWLYSAYYVHFTVFYLLCSTQTPQNEKRPPSVAVLLKQGHPFYMYQNIVQIFSIPRNLLQGVPRNLWSILSGTLWGIPGTYSGHTSEITLSRIQKLTLATTCTPGLTQTGAYSPELALRHTMELTQTGHTPEFTMRHTPELTLSTLRNLL